MKTHLTVIGAIYTALGAVGLIIAAIAAVAIAGGGIISQDPQAITITSYVSMFIGGLFAILALPSIIGGLGLLMGQPWARILVLVIGCVCLLLIPFGTILGIYTIWALTRPETAEILSRRDAFQ